MTCRFSLILVVLLAGWAAAQGLPQSGSSSSDQRPSSAIESDGERTGWTHRSTRRQERVALRGRRRAADPPQRAATTPAHPLQPPVPTGQTATTPSRSAVAAEANPESRLDLTPPETDAEAKPPATAPEAEDQPVRPKTDRLEKPAPQPPGSGERAEGQPRQQPRSSKASADQQPPSGARTEEGPLEEDRTEEVPSDEDLQERSQPSTGNEAAGQTEASPSSEPALPTHLVKLKAKVHQALDIYRHRMLNTAEDCHWSIMHSLIAFGVEKQVRIGSPQGKPVNAIGWICYNYPCRGERLFYLDQDNIRGRRGPGRQGHEGQFLAMLAQSRVNINYPMKIQGRDFAVRDLVHSEMDSCRAGTELTFKLIGLAYYLDLDRQWRSDNGDRWNIERLMVEEIQQPINGAACGGTHRLFGLSAGVKKRQQSDLPLDGIFARAARYLQQYHHYTFHLQNRDGSFSTEFFTGRGFDTDRKRRMLTSGHVAEWLAFSLPEDQLHRPEMVRAVDYLCDLLIRGKNYDWEVGPLGHTLHALNIYCRRALRESQPSDVLAAFSTDAD